MIISCFCVSANAAEEGNKLAFRWMPKPIPKAKVQQFLLLISELTERDIFLSIDLLKPLFLVPKEIKDTLDKASKTTYPIFTKSSALDYARILELFDFYFYAWSSAFAQETTLQIRHLTSLLGFHENSVQIHGARQLQTIRSLLRSLSIDLAAIDVSVKQENKQFEHTQKLLNAIQAQVIALDYDIKKRIAKIDGLLSPFNLTHEPELIYGSALWDDLVKKRPPEPRHWITTNFGAVLSYLNPLNYLPATWRPSNQQLWGLLAIALLIAHRIESMIELNSTSLSKRDNYQEKILSRAEITQINKEVALIGTILSDKYKSLADTESLKSLTRRYPAVAQTLENIRDQFGSNGVSDQEIIQIMHEYRSHRLPHEMSQ